MYCRGSRRLLLIALTAFVFDGCARRQGAGATERLAVLRFENLSADLSSDWMGRAFSEIITAELAGAPGLYAIPGGRIRVLNPVLGIRPVAAPGISAERARALAAGANRIGYGTWSVVGGKLLARLTVEDPETGKMTRVISATAPPGDVVAAATSLARQISSQATAYGTRDPRAIRSWVSVMESQGPDTPDKLREAIAADPDFGPPYLALAEYRLQQRDAAGARSVLEQALARGDRLPAAERARIAFDLARLSGDTVSQQRALASLLKLAPNDGDAWRAQAEFTYAHRQYAAAVQAFQKVLELENDPSAANTLGYAAAFNGDLDTAVRAMRRYQAAHINDVNALDSLGDVYLIENRLREAESYYLQAAKLNPAFLNGADYFKAAMARLMSGDVSGADTLAKQYADARAAAGDPQADFHRAEWSWISGRRSEALTQMLAYARARETGARKELASRAYAQLAIWNLLLGDRVTAAAFAERSAPLAGPASIGLSVLARFLAQPPATPAEWTARRGRALPAGTPATFADLAMAYALLLDKQFQPAANVLQHLYNNTAPNSDEAAGILLAWALVETGRSTEAAALLRINPLPAPTGVSPTMGFYFPRLYYLRGRLGDRDANFRLFLQLSGDRPLAWGEEQAARGR